MTLAMLVRGDQGGLAALTYEMWRHLKPRRTIVVMLPAARGQIIRDMYADPPAGCEVKWVPLNALERNMPWLLKGTTLLWTAETWYAPTVRDYTRRAHVKTVLLAMPELWTPAEDADTIWIPTTWRADLVPGAEVVPVPIALDSLPYRERTRAQQFFHPAAPAMLDRNGTHSFEDAITYDNAEFFERGIGTNAVIRSGETSGRGDLRIEWLPPCERYEEVIPPSTDVMVIPRRYGGLCLPFAEACARGIPTIMTAIEPQLSWFPDSTIADEMFVPVDPVRTETHRMKGGMVDVYSADPMFLAQRLYRLIAEPSLVKELSGEVRAWAERMAWSGLAGDEVRERIAELVA